MDLKGQTARGTYNRVIKIILIRCALARARAATTLTAPIPSAFRALTRPSQIAMRNKRGALALPRESTGQDAAAYTGSQNGSVTLDMSLIASLDTYALAATPSQKNVLQATGLAAPLINNVTAARALPGITFQTTPLRLTCALPQQTKPSA